MFRFSIDHGAAASKLSASTCLHRQSSSKIAYGLNFRPRHQYSSASRTSETAGFQDIHDKPASAYGWRYHADNTTQFVLWAAFGSAAIHLLNIKQKYKEKDRRLSTKIAVLKDIIRRVGEGEDVDIARELQVGKTEEEKEWEEVMNTFKEAAGLSPEEIERVNASARATEAQEEQSQQQKTRQENQGTARGSSSKIKSTGWFWQT